MTMIFNTRDAEIVDYVASRVLHHVDDIVSSPLLGLDADLVAWVEAVSQRGESSEMPLAVDWANESNLGAVTDAVSAVVDWEAVTAGETATPEWREARAEEVAHVLLLAHYIAEARRTGRWQNLADHRIGICVAGLLEAVADQVHPWWPCSGTGSTTQA